MLFLGLIKTIMMKNNKLIITLFLFLFSCLANAQMVLEYNIATANTQIALPLAGTVNVTVNWGDGTPNEVFSSAGDKPHTYVTTGTKTVTITGTLSAFGSSTNSTGNARLTKVLSWDGLGLTSFNNAFNGAELLTQVPTSLPSSVTDLSNMFVNAKSFNSPINTWNTINITNMRYIFSNAFAFNQPIDSWNTSNVTNMEGMFSFAIAFNQPIGNWNTSSVTSMNSMFSNSRLFNQPINSWITSNVTSMDAMFSKAGSFNQPLSTWNTSSVTNMRYMFEGAYSFNQTIGNWNTANVVDMSNMFLDAWSFNQPLDGWITSSVTNMAGMFRYAKAFNQPIGSWNTARVTSMRAMFDKASVFNQPIGSWNTQAVTDMFGMFFEASLFNQPINFWNTSSVTDMSYMFGSASSFNQPIANWNTTKVGNMSNMFVNAIAFNQPVGMWNITTVSNMNNMFFGTSLCTENYDNLLNGWAAQVVKSGVTFQGGGSKYSSASSAARATLISKGWTISDAGLGIISGDKCSSKWNGTSWNPKLPDIVTPAILDGNYSTLLNGNIICQALTINSGKSLELNSGTLVTVSGNLVNNGTIINCGSLNVSGTTTGTGTTIGSKYKIDPQTVVCAGTTTNFSVPISTIGAIAGGLVSLDFDLFYDVTKVTPTGTATIGVVGNTTFGTYFLNTATPGKVGVSVYLNGQPANTFFSGTGTVISLNFSVKTGVVLGSILTNFTTGDIVESKMFSSTIMCPAQAGSFTYTRRFNGQLQYRNTALKISGVAGQNPTAITPLTGGCTGTALTAPAIDANGLFSVQNNALSHLRISREIAGHSGLAAASCTNVQSVIGATDRAVVTQIITGAITPTIYQLLAADVNLDGKVTGADASLISSRGTNLYNCEFPQLWNYEENASFNVVPKASYGRSKDWLFVDLSLLSAAPYSTATKLTVPSVPDCIPVGVDLTQCTSVPVDKNYAGIMLGDVDGTWALANGTNMRAEEQTLEMVVDLENTVSTSTGTLLVPVKVALADSLIGVDFSWDYDQNEVVFKDLTISESYKNKMGTVFNDQKEAQRFMATVYIEKEKVVGNSTVFFFELEEMGNQSPETYFSNITAYINGKPAQVKVGQLPVITGLANVKEYGKFSLYPNPTTGLMYLSGTGNENLKVEVTNAMGAVVKTQEVSNSSTPLDMSELSSGVYYVKIHAKNGTEVVKVTRQ